MFSYMKKDPLDEWNEMKNSISILIGGFPIEIETQLKASLLHIVKLFLDYKDS